MNTSLRDTSLYVGRLAPAPTGALHLGNARTFLVAWLRARMRGGRLILRIEDLDHPKVKPAAVDGVHRDLSWMGLDWDGEVFVQSRRLAEYSSVLERLRLGGFVYPCICTRKNLDQYLSAPNAGEDAVERRYPGTCRGRFGSACDAERVSGREALWRFRVRDGEETSFVDGFAGARESVLSEWSGDFPVARGDAAGYQLAVVVDDHDMGVTEAVRGDDLIPSTHRQLALYRALGWEPPSFYHLPLVVGADGRRLAKRHGDTRLSALRAAGGRAERLLGWLAFTCGWVDSLTEISLAEIMGLCDFSSMFSSMPRGRVVVGERDLAWLGL